MKQKNASNDSNKNIRYHWMTINIYLFIYDAIVLAGAYFFALWLRFDCKFSAIDPEYFSMYLKFIPFYIAVSLIIFACLGLYHSIWRFAGNRELELVIASSAITTIIHIIGMSLFLGRMPISYYIIGAMLQFVLVVGIRFSYRFVLLLRSQKKTSAGDNVLLIGAGSAGRMILRDIRMSDKSDDKVVAIIDDNPNKWNRYIDGVCVVGGRNDIFSTVEKYKVKKIYFAIPTATPEDRKEILNICQETGCEVKNLPGLVQIVNGEVTLADMKDVSVEELLGRDTIKVNNEEILNSLENKVILVTGGGGSIGSELCRQIAGHKPRLLLIFDVYENNAYDIQQELKRSHPDLNLEVLIGSVRDSRRMYQIFETYHPQIVFHAAAHKHVPLMEVSPCEAIKNNAIGTYKTAFAAMVHGCQRFVLISTDKAVNLTNVMGASKRICEMIIQAFDYYVKQGKADQIPQLFTHSSSAFKKNKKNLEALQKCRTEFVAVRFGNVLGSNGSVIPLFKRQIAEGGPVTVTHPDIIRYFMTIPEAVSLVLQAEVYAKGGEIFILDMGSPMKIDTLARNLIRMSGFKPDVDIKIEYTGLRPGEKLYEEKLMAEEGLVKTDNDLIHIGKPIPFDISAFLDQLDTLMEYAYQNNIESTKQQIRDIVDTYAG